MMQAYLKRSITSQSKLGLILLLKYPIEQCLRTSTLIMLDYYDEDIQRFFRE